MRGAWHWECEEAFFDDVPVRSFYVRAWHDEFPDKPIGGHFSMSGERHGLENAVNSLLPYLNKLLAIWREQAA